MRVFWHCKWNLLTTCYAQQTKHQYWSDMAGFYFFYSNLNKINDLKEVSKWYVHGYSQPNMKIQDLWKIWYIVKHQVFDNFKYSFFLSLFQILNIFHICIDYRLRLHWLRIKLMIWFWRKFQRDLLAPLSISGDLLYID